MSEQHKKRSVCNVILLLGLAVLLTLPFAYYNLDDPNFWFDESGQFWMARGLHHFSLPLSTEGSFDQIIANNRQYNLDPGGFTLLLHYWSDVRTDPVWLRTLPYIFLVITVYFLLQLVYSFTGAILPSVAAASLIPVLFPLVLGYGFELRPYSMEVAGVVVSLFLLTRVIQCPTRVNLAVLGLTCSFFLTARYSFVIDIAAVGIVLFGFVFKRSLKQSLLRGAYFYLPVACTALMIWFISLSQQDPGGPTPFYVKGLVLSGKSLPEILYLIQANFFSPRGLPILALAVLFPFIQLTQWGRTGILGQRQFRSVYLYVISFQIFSILLSAAGKYPWHINTRWNLNLQAVSLIASAMLVIVGWEYVRKRFRIAAARPCLNLILSIGLLTASVTSAEQKVHISYDATYSYLSRLSDNELTNSRYFVGYYAQPTVRYLFEYGPLKHRSDIYPRNFVFEQSEAFYKQAKIDGDAVDTALISLISPEDLSDKYLKRFSRPFRPVSGQGLSHILVREFRGE